MEEDLKLLEGIDVKFFISGHEASNYIIDRADRINTAIEHLLSEYKKLKEENKELKSSSDFADSTSFYYINKLTMENHKLKEENEEYNKQLDLDYVKNNYIPKQAIIDIIEELNKELDSIRKYGHINKLYVVTNQISILEELLERNK